jgi:hypothetical protein
MLLGAPEEHHVSTMIVLGFVGGGLLLYGFGYARAVMHRANDDFKKTKAAVPVLRKDFWRTWWKAVKAATLGLIIFAALAVWMWNEVNDDPADATTNPTPSPSVSRSPR